jgi:tRNA1(Val) A37 N6-methylase TrmN6
VTDNSAENMRNINDTAALAARSFFPRGLVQPPGTFRFSAEALFPAVYAGLRSGMRLLDMGTGCGVTALAALCLHPALRVVGVEILPEAVAAAALNAERLGFSHAFRVIHADLADRTALFVPNAASAAAGADAADLTTSVQHAVWDSAATDDTGRAPGRITARSFDAATANPPYRQRGRGRLPASEARRTALFEEPGTLDVFCAAAAEALKGTGRLILVYPAARLPDVTAALDRAALHLVRMLPLCPRAGSAAALLLLEAAPAGSTASLPPRCDAPLILHGADGRLTPAALQFCPFLACNA